MTRAALEKLLGRALRELDLAERTGEALGAPPKLPARVIAIGKAAPAMAAGAIARWKNMVESCLIVVPEETPLDELRLAAAQGGLSGRLFVIRASHPLPDARSVRAARACLLAVAAEAPRRIVVLVSGGASALVCAPSAGVTMMQKRDLTRAMLRSGASIQELNVVRKHLSKIKGGGLARAAGRNAVLTLIASDVIGGTAADVGSGPSAFDTSTVAQARVLIRRYAPAFARLPLAATLRAGEAGTKRLPARLIASPEALAQAMATLLRERGLLVRVLPPSQASAAELAADYAARAARPGPCAFVRSAEPSLVVPSRAGRGGRSTHLAALVGRALPPRRRVTFAAFASDGVDGTSGTGGAIIDQRFAMRAAVQLGEAALDRAIARFDTGSLHRALGTAVLSAGAGHNLADVHVLLLD